MGYASRAKWAKRNAAAAELMFGQGERSSAGRGGGKTFASNWRRKAAEALARMRSAFDGHKRFRIWGQR